MRRELWSIGCCFGYAIRVLNSIFCTDCKDEHELDEEETWLVVERINSMCSDMMVEDVSDIIGMVSVIPTGRLCERTDCDYHHPEHFQKHDYTIYKDKCDECVDNSKCKLDEDSRMSHYECA